jgi:hypothetical protein
MDRGFVFKQINNYISCFAPGDPKVAWLLHAVLCVSLEVHLLSVLRMFFQFQKPSSLLLEMVALTVLTYVNYWGMVLQNKK